MAEQQYISGNITVQEAAKSKAIEMFKAQNDAYDKAKSARKFTIATQIVLGVIWGINALDAGLVEPAYPSEGFAFEARPTFDGGQIMVYVPF